MGGPGPGPAPMQNLYWGGGPGGAPVGGAAAPVGGMGLDGGWGTGGYGPANW